MQDIRFSFEAIGTHWVIDCFDVLISKSKIETLIKDRIEEFDKTYSRFRNDSLIWKISQKKGIYKFPPDSKDFFTLYDKLNKITQGSFTLLIGNTLDEAGYDHNYSLIPKKINTLPKDSEIYEFEYPNLKVKAPFILDFGGLGKGYLIDLISKILEKENVISYCIDGGGDIFYKNLKSDLKVGLEHPENLKQVIGVVSLKSGQSICASSGNRRKWDKFHHIINPTSLESPQHILATWVIAKDAVTADGIATCLFLSEAKMFSKYFKFEYLILYPDYTFKKSNNFVADIFIKKENLVQ